MLFGVLLKKHWVKHGHPLGLGDSQEAAVKASDERRDQQHGQFEGKDLLKDQ
jgi:hypothetical protein